MGYFRVKKTKDMKYLNIIALCALFCLCACERVDVTPKEEVEEDKLDLYYTAVSYDMDYDWRRDSLGGLVSRRIILFKNHQKVLAEVISALDYDATEPQKHRIMDGHLYTIHDTDFGIQINRDAEPYQSFGASESICDMLVHGGHFYTLACPVDGRDRGVRLRRDGEIIYESKEAVSMGDLYTDGQDLCFSCCEMLHSIGGGKAYKYYSVENGEAKMTDVPPTVTDVMAMRREGKVMNMIVREANISDAVWIQGRTSIIIGDSRATGIRNCSFIKKGGTLYAHAQMNMPHNDGRYWNDYFWTREKMVCNTDRQDQILSMDFNRDGGSLCFIYSPMAGKGGLGLYHQGKRSVLPDKYYQFSPYALCSTSSRVCAGLNDRDKGNTPVVIDGAQTIDMDFNGFFTHFTLD